MKITMTLDSRSVERAIEAVKRYTEDVNRKTQELRKLVARNIAWSASEGFSTAVADDFVGEEMRMADVTVTVNDVGNISVIIASGKDAVFVEFGAGVSSNGGAGSSPHSKGEEMGYTIGGYGHGFGQNMIWGFTDESGHHVTRGTPARMPMFRGVEEASRTIYELAREVFRT